MDEQRLPRSIGRLITRYINVFGPQRIVLFGSYAKGKPTLGSDVDLLIIADLTGDASTNLRRAHQLAADCFPPVDVIFATSEEAERSTVDQNLFLLSALTTGVVLYERKEPLT